VTAGLGAWFITIAGTVATLILLTLGKTVEHWLIRLFSGRDLSEDELES
jgi:putative Mg2+ transporter-C (MgtC) family protein